MTKWFFITALEKRGRVAKSTDKLSFTNLLSKGDSYTVPAAVRSAAKRGLELRKKQPKSGKAGLDTREAAKQGIGSGVARARDLMSGSVSKETIKRMHAYFSRHQGNYKLDAGKKPHEDKGYVAGLLWGGEAGRSFAARMVKKFEREDSKKKKSRALSFSALVKGEDEPKNGKEESEAPKEESEAPKEEPPPRSLLAIIKAAGSEGVTFEDIIRRYSQAAGLRSRKVNRTTIRYSLNKMIDGGKVKTLNRGGDTVYVAAGGDKDGKDSERDTE